MSVDQPITAQSITGEFWQYAKEAILSAATAKTDDDRQDLLELARTWTQAALQARESADRLGPDSRSNVINFKQNRLGGSGNLGVMAANRGSDDLDSSIHQQYGV
jgi:hypothetical protein